MTLLLLVVMSHDNSCVAFPSEENERITISTYHRAPTTSLYYLGYEHKCGLTTFLASGNDQSNSNQIMH